MRLSPRNWLLLFFMLWLPIQGVAAAVLSVCAEEESLTSHHNRKLAITNDDHYHTACHKQATENSIEIDRVFASIACDDTSCDVYSNTPITQNYAESISVNKIPAEFVFDSGLFSFIPKQPQRPPLYFYL